MALPKGWSRNKSEENKPREIEQNDSLRETVLDYNHNSGWRVFVRYYPVFREVDESPYFVYWNGPEGPSGKNGEWGTGRDSGFDTFKEARKQAQNAMRNLNRKEIHG